MALLKEHKYTVPALFQIDYLRFTLWAGFSEALIVLELLGLDHDPEYSGHGGNGFKMLYNGKNGERVGAVPVGSDSDYTHFDLSGEVCEKITPDAFMSFVDFLKQTEWKKKITRLDFAFDTQNFGNEQIWRTIKQRNFTSYVKEDNIDRRENLTGSEDTIYIGSRDSLQYMRIYVKTIEEHPAFGNEPFTRMELELHDERAQAALLWIGTEPIERWAEVGIAHIRGFIEFKAKWWTRFVGQVAAFWLKIEREKPTIERARAWIEEQVCPSLALVAYALCPTVVDDDGVITDDMVTFVRRFIEDGRARWTDKHVDMLERFHPDIRQSVAVFNGGSWAVPPSDTAVGSRYTGNREVINPFNDRVIRRQAHIN